MGRDKILEDALGTLTFQSTRPHGARRAGVRLLAVRTSVSIHAPAWGATGTCTVQPEANVVSIHAPAWGATTKMDLSMLYSLFQSTRPHGARPALLLSLVAETCFNPRARMGRDRHTSWIGPRCRCFNPRARMGRDEAALT